MAGGMEFNRGKFEELIVYLATRLGPEAALGRVKLAKLLMLSDFQSYGRRGHSITGATYQKWEHGHFPRELVIAEKDLSSDGSGAISEESVDYYGKRLRRLTAHREPRLSDFDEDELAIIEGVIRRYGHESATYLSALSHKELGWRLANDKEEIPYNTFFLGRGVVVDEDIRRGEELASLHGWN